MDTQSHGLQATSGSGTEDDPFSGTVTAIGAQLCEIGRQSAEIWVEQGTTFDVTIEAESPWTPTHSHEMEVDVGLSFIYSGTSGQRLVGNASSPGVCSIVMGTIDYGIDWELTIHVVATGPVLTFQSDPITDGILIPPNHHLVRFMSDFSDVPTTYEIVEHGGYAQSPELPYIGGGSYIWTFDYDPTNWVDLTYYAINQDITFYLTTTHN